MAACHLPLASAHARNIQPPTPEPYPSVPLVMRSEWVLGRDWSTHATTISAECCRVAQEALSVLCGISRVRPLYENGMLVRFAARWKAARTSSIAALRALGVLPASLALTAYVTFC